jgi:hypothetical protein
MATQWERVDRPVLEKVAELGGDDEDPIRNTHVLTEALGDDFDQRRVARSVGRLVDGRYLDASDACSSDSDEWLAIRLAEKGRRFVGMWPSDDAARALLELLDERIAQEDDPDERTRLQGLREAAKNVGQGVLSGVLVEAFKRGLMF